MNTLLEQNSFICRDLEYLKNSSKTMLLLEGRTRTHAPRLHYGPGTYIFLVVLGLGCCTRAFSSCDDGGLLFVAEHGLLIVMASLVLEHRL